MCITILDYLSVCLKFHKSKNKTDLCQHIALLCARDTTISEVPAVRHSEGTLWWRSWTGELMGRLRDKYEV